MNDLPDTPVETEEPAEPAPEAETKKKIDWLAEIRGLALMLLGVVAFHTLVAKPFYIPSGSMMPNLLVGDRLIVSKYPYGWSWVSMSFPLRLLPRDDWRIAPGMPEYGDIVVPVPPDRAEDYIKRVVALPGDRIAVVNGQIILNGEPVPQEVEPGVQIPVADEQMCEGTPCLEMFEDYRKRLPDGREVYEPPTYRETLPNGASYLIIDHTASPRDNYREIVVPEDHVFLMGDNRDHSSDSRFEAAPIENGLGGPVPIANIGGRAEIITFSLDGSAGWNPVSWFEALRPDRAWTTLRPELRGRPRETGGGNGRD
jgi:signal peptidase I